MPISFEDALAGADDLPDLTKKFNDALAGADAIPDLTQKFNVALAGASALPDLDKRLADALAGADMIPEVPAPAPAQQTGDYFYNPPTPQIIPQSQAAFEDQPPTLDFNRVLSTPAPAAQPRIVYAGNEAPVGSTAPQTTAPPLFVRGAMGVLQGGVGLAGQVGALAEWAGAAQTAADPAKRTGELLRHIGEGLRVSTDAANKDLVQRLGPTGGTVLWGEGEEAVRTEDVVQELGKWAMPLVALPLATEALIPTMYESAVAPAAAILRGTSVGRRVGFLMERIFPRLSVKTGAREVAQKTLGAGTGTSMAAGDLRNIDPLLNLAATGVSSALTNAIFTSTAQWQKAKSEGKSDDEAMGEASVAAGLGLATGLTAVSRLVPQNKLPLRVLTGMVRGGLENGYRDLVGKVASGEDVTFDKQAQLAVLSGMLTEGLISAPRNRLGVRGGGRREDAGTEDARSPVNEAYAKAEALLRKHGDDFEAAMADPEVPKPPTAPAPETPVSSVSQPAATGETPAAPVSPAAAAAPTEPAPAPVTPEGEEDGGAASIANLPVVKAWIQKMAAQRLPGEEKAKAEKAAIAERKAIKEQTRQQKEQAAAERRAAREAATVKFTDPQEAVAWLDRGVAAGRDPQKLAKLNPTQLVREVLAGELNQRGIPIGQGRKLNRQEQEAARVILDGVAAEGRVTPQEAGKILLAVKDAGVALTDQVAANEEMSRTINLVSAGMGMKEALALPPEARQAADEVAVAFEGGDQTYWDKAAALAEDFNIEHNATTGRFVSAEEPAPAAQEAQAEPAAAPEPEPTITVEQRRNLISRIRGAGEKVEPFIAENFPGRTIWTVTPGDYRRALSALRPAQSAERPVRKGQERIAVPSGYEPPVVDVRGKRVEVKHVDGSPMKPEVAAVLAFHGFREAKGNVWIGTADDARVALARQLEQGAPVSYVVRQPKLSEWIRKQGGVLPTDDYQKNTSNRQKALLRRMGAVSEKGQEAAALVAKLAEEYPNAGIATPEQLFAAIRSKDHMDSLLSKTGPARPAPVVEKAPEAPAPAPAQPQLALDGPKEVPGRQPASAVPGESPLKGVEPAGGTPPVAGQDESLLSAAKEALGPNPSPEDKALLDEWEARERTYNEFIAQKSEELKYGGKIVLKDGRVKIISPNIDPSNREKYPLRITSIDKDGEPHGHEIYKDMREAVKDLRYWYSQDLVAETIPAPPPAAKAAPAPAPAADFALENPEAKAPAPVKPANEDQPLGMELPKPVVPTTAIAKGQEDRGLSGLALESAAAQDEAARQQQALPIDQPAAQPAPAAPAPVPASVSPPKIRFRNDLSQKRYYLELEKTPGQLGKETVKRLTDLGFKHNRNTKTWSVVPAADEAQRLAQVVLGKELSGQQLVPVNQPAERRPQKMSLSQVFGKLSAAQIERIQGIVGETDDSRVRSRFERMVRNNAGEGREVSLEDMLAEALMDRDAGAVLRAHGITGSTPNDVERLAEVLSDYEEANRRVPIGDAALEREAQAAEQEAIEGVDPSLLRKVQIEVEGKKQTVSLLPEQAAEWDAAEQEYREGVEFAKRLPEQEQRSVIKALGLDWAKEKRRITGIFNQAELEAQAKALMEQEPAQYGEAEPEARGTTETSGPISRHADGTITISNFSAITPKQYQQIAKIMQRLGYAWDSGEAARQSMERSYNRPISPTGFGDEDVSKALTQVFFKGKKPARTADQKLFAKAVREFGTTTDFNEAGYLLPNGTMLDFSGKREGGWAGKRAFDHRDINRVVESDGTQAMQDFMAMGAIRLMPENSGIDLAKTPTKEQRTMLSRLVARAKGEVVVDLQDGWGAKTRPDDNYYPDPDRTFYREYPQGTPASRVLADIDRFFAGGTPSELSQFRQDAGGYGDAQVSPVFYSALTKTIEDKVGGRVRSSELLKMLENTQGVKGEELEWTRLKDFLSENKVVTKQEVKDFLAENQVQIQEVVKGGKSVAGELFDSREEAEDAASRAYPDGDIDWSVDETDEGQWQINAPTGNRVDPKFSQYTLPGGENYRELLLTLPIDQNAEQRARSIRLNELIAKRDDLLNQVQEIRVVGSATAAHKEELSRQLRNVGTQIDMVMKERNEAGARTAFKSSHYDEPNILAHIRFNERTDAEGKRVLFIEEIQSDWHQAGREKGYATPQKPDDLGIAKIVPTGDTTEGMQYVALNQAGDMLGWGASEEDVRNNLERSAREVGVARQFEQRHRDEVPDAPFKKTWHELAMKRALRWAAENGFDRVAWTTGEQQAERYDLSKQVSEEGIHWQTEGDGQVRLYAKGAYGQGVILDEVMPLEKAADYVGKDAAREIAGAIERGSALGDLQGEQLKVGGEGMKGFYDQILPVFANKYAKKWGAKVGKTTIFRDTYDTDDLDELMDGSFVPKEGAISEQEGVVVHSIDITPEMQRDILKGQPLFQDKGEYKPSSRAEQRRQEVEGGQLVFNFEIAGTQSPIAKNKKPVELVSRTIAAQEKATGYARIVGLPVATKEAMAVAAQAVRDPYAEHLRLVFFDRKTGQVVAVEHYSSLATDAVGDLFSAGWDGKGGDEGLAAHRQLQQVEFKKRLKLMAEGGRQVGVWLLHNHPSGTATPSKADMQATRTYRNSMAGIEGLAYQGHIIINSGEYTVLPADDATGSKATLYDLDSHEVLAKFRAVPEGMRVVPEAGVDLEALRQLKAQQDPLLSLEGSPAYDQMALNGPTKIAEFGVSLKKPQNAPTVLFMSAAWRVRGAVAVPVEMMNNTAEFTKWLADRKREYGASQIAVFQDGDGPSLIEAGKALIRNGHIDEMVQVTGSDAYGKPVRRSAVEEMGGNQGIIDRRRRLAAQRGPLPMARLEQVSPAQARELPYETKLPTDPIFAEAVAGTPGAQITPDGLLIDLVRYQKDYQAGEPSVRTGVFYLPAKDKNQRHYYSARSAYGGPMKVQGQTLLRAPLFVKGATGGKAPEAAFNTLRGKGAVRALQVEIRKTTSANLIGRTTNRVAVVELLNKYGIPAAESEADLIIHNSNQANQLLYALQERIVAQTVREAGYDSVVGYSTRRSGGGAFISEVFDVREVMYPESGEEASAIHPAFQVASTFRFSQPVEEYGDQQVEPKEPKIRHTLDTATADPEREYRGAGRIENGELVTYHASRNPGRVIEAVNNKEDVSAWGNEFDDLNTGLYASDAPGYWKGRDTSRLDYLENLTPEQTEKLAQEVERRLDAEKSTGYMTKGEYEYGKRAVQQLRAGNNYISTLGGQPWNIPVGSPDFIQSIGAVPTESGGLVELRLKGKFAELVVPNLPRSEQLWLQQNGYDGAYTPPGFSSQAQLVIWNSGAVQSAKPARMLDTGRVVNEEQLAQEREQAQALLNQMEQEPGQYDVAEAGAITSEEKVAAKRAWQEQGVESPWFKKWFGNSKVTRITGMERTPSGEWIEETAPLKVYHGTDQKFAVFNVDGIGSHFGTRKQARARLEGKTGTVRAYYLRIQNPVRMADVGEWDRADRVADVAQMDGIISTDQLRQIMEIGRHGEAWDSIDPARFALLKKMMMDAGYDGIVYANEHEDEEAGDDSYIIFSPEQAKSDKNSGIFSGSPSVLEQEGGVYGDMEPTPGISEGKDPAPYPDPEMQKAHEENHGIRSKPLRESVEEIGEYLKGKIFREMMYLPKTPEFESLRYALNRLSGRRGAANIFTYGDLERITEGLSATERSIFEKKVYLDDLVQMADTRDDYTFPVSFSEAAVRAKVPVADYVRQQAEYFTQQASGFPAIQEAMARRAKAWDDLKKELLDSANAAGFDLSDKLNNPAYFRHQILEYAQKNNLIPRGTLIREPKRNAGGVLMRREGSEKEHNRAYLDAEFEAMTNLRYAAYKNRVLAEVRKLSVYDALVQQAKDHNATVMEGVWQQIADGYNRENPEAKPITAEQAKADFTTKQAMAVGKLTELAQAGVLPTNGGQWDNFLANLANGTESRVEGDNLIAYAGWLLAQNGALKKARLAVKQAAPGSAAQAEAKRQVFAIMEGLGGQEGVGVPEAALLFKGISEKTEFTNTILKQMGQLKGWQDFLNKDTHSEWYPEDDRSMWATAYTLPEHMAVDFLLGEMADLSELKPDQLKTVLYRAGQRPPFVVPHEVAQTLDAMADRLAPNQGLVGGAFAALQRAWKVNVLIGPTRFWKYNLRNLTGDAEAIMLGNPRVMSEVPAAARELWDAIVMARVPEEGSLLWKYINEGGLASDLAQVEMGGIGELRRLKDKFGLQEMGRMERALKLGAKPFTAYFKGARIATDYREAILKYAAFRQFRAEMEKNGGVPKSWGASDRRRIMGLETIDQRAFQMANDLLGAYDEVGEMGQWLRTYLMPFYSWEEVNTRRYKRLLMNAMENQGLMEVVGMGWAERLKRMSGFYGKQAAAKAVTIPARILVRLGLFGLQMMGMWMGLNLWNHYGRARMYGTDPDDPNDDPEKDLELYNPEIAYAPHLTLGRDEKGKVLALTRLGVLTSLLEWGGVDRLPRLMQRYLSGDASGLENLSRFLVTLGFDDRRPDQSLGQMVGAAWEDVTAGKGRLEKGFRERAALRPGGADAEQGYILHELMMGPTQKLMNMVGVLPIKAGAELVAGQTYYPRWDRPKPISSNTEYLLGIMGREYVDLYRRLPGMDLPHEEMDTADPAAYLKALSDIFLYRVDPKESAYWTAYHIQAQYMDSIGKGKQGGFWTEKHQALMDLKATMRYNQPELTKKYLDRYLTLAGTMQGVRESINQMEPLAQIPADQRAKFAANLTPEEKKVVTMALKYYEETLVDDGGFDEMLKQYLPLFAKAKSTQFMDARREIARYQGQAAALRKLGRLDEADGAQALADALIDRGGGWRNIQRNMGVYYTEEGGRRRKVNEFLAFKTMRARYFRTYLDQLQQHPIDGMPWTEEELAGGQKFNVYGEPVEEQSFQQATGMEDAVFPGE